MSGAATRAMASTGSELAEAGEAPAGSGEVRGEARGGEIVVFACAGLDDRIGGAQRVVHQARMAHDQRLPRPSPEEAREHRRVVGIGREGVNTAKRVIGGEPEATGGAPQRQRQDRQQHRLEGSDPPRQHTGRRLPADAQPWPCASRALLQQFEHCLADAGEQVDVLVAIDEIGKPAARLGEGVPLPGDRGGR